MFRHMTARGWLHQEERDLLYNLALGVPAGGNIVNIGVEYGASMTCLGDGSLPNVHLTGIDIDLSRFEGPQYGNRLTFVEGDSGEVVNYWHKPIDLLFIDGDHSEKGVRRDLEWVKFVKPQGYVAFHDCYDYSQGSPLPHGICPEVNEVVEEWYRSTQGKFAEVEGAWTIRIFVRLQ